MILHDVLKQVDAADVAAIVDCLCEREYVRDEVEEYGFAHVVACYADFVRRLQEVVPAPQPGEEGMVLLGAPRKTELLLEGDRTRAFVSVDLYKKADLRRLDPRTLAADSFFSGPGLSDDDVAKRAEALRERPAESWAYEFRPWEEALGYEVSWDNITRCGLHEFLADVLEELSFNGLTGESQDERRAEFEENLRPFREWQEKSKGMSEEESLRSLEEMCGAREMDPEEFRTDRAWETPAFRAENNRNQLWNAAQQRRAVLRWLGAVPAFEQLGQD